PEIVARRPRPSPSSRIARRRSRPRPKRRRTQPRPVSTPTIRSLGSAGSDATVSRTRVVVASTASRFHIARVRIRLNLPVRPAADRLAVLGVTDALDADRLAAVAGPAQLADDLARGEAVHALSDQRRPPAVDAARGPVAHGARALAQERALELALPDAEDRSQHGRGFAAPAWSPAAARGRRPAARRAGAPARRRSRASKPCRDAAPGT